MITQELLKKHMTYDPETGVFTNNLSRGGNVRKGSVVGYDHHDGYKRTIFLKKDYALHRLAWFYVYGEWPKGEIDHINGCRSDNRIINLRDVSKSVNQGNSTSRRLGKTTSKYHGVYWCKQKNKWHARAFIGGKTVHVGFFSNEDSAFEARKQTFVQV